MLKITVAHKDIANHLSDDTLMSYVPEGIQVTAIMGEEGDATLDPTVMLQNLTSGVVSMTGEIHVNEDEFKTATSYRIQLFDKDETDETKWEIRPHAEWVTDSLDFV